MRSPDVVRATEDQRAALYQRLRTLVDASLLDQTAAFPVLRGAALEQTNLGDCSSELLREIVNESGEANAV